MEYKRAAVMLPSILKRAIMLAAVCLAAAGVAVFCAGVLQGDRDEGNRLRVGYTAKADPLTDLAVAYIQNIESIKSFCSLEAVTEQEGRRLLESGELSALIVLPEDVVNEILSGSNTPAVLYLPERHGGAASGGLGAVGSVLLEEIASAGMGMLATAQAEIYASDAILHTLSSEYAPESMYDDINRFNLQMAAGREKLFRTRTLSLTENDTYVVYFGSALFTVYVLSAGLFFGKYCKRSSLQQTMADRRVGVCYAAQLLARCLAGSALMAAVLLLPSLAVFVLNRIPRADSVPADPIAIAVTWQGMASLFLITGFMTVYFMTIYQIVEKRESALVVTGILAVLQAYLSGCLIPTVLLPDAAAAVGAFLPASMVKRGFTIVLTGDVQSFPYVA
ncbi:MAG: ABC transporter permease, partial [Lachnospiraceae bacterium]|nr:ABC transporter permease [Lachnospiraceae bacterium]